MKNGEFKIEKNKPMPASRSGKSKYPFAQMKVGDSFRVEGVMAAKVSRSMTTYGKLLKMKFSQRQEGEGYRIWRTK